MHIVKNSWFTISAILLAWLLSQTVLHQWLDRWGRDYQQLIAAEEMYFLDSVVLDIDNSSLRKLEPQFGVWPYKRDAYAVLLDYLTEKGASTVVFDILFAESRMRDERFRESIAKNGKAVFVAAAPTTPVPLSNEDWSRLEGMSWGNSDDIPSMQLSSIVLPNIDIVGGDPEKNKVGIITAAADEDGVLRSMPLLYRLGKVLLPSMPLRLINAKTDKADVQFKKDENILSIGKRQWRVDSKGALKLYFPENSNSILTLPFSDVAEAALGIHPVESDDEFFRNKTVFIGSTAYLSDRVNTPRGMMSGTYLLAIANETMKHGLSIKSDDRLWNSLLVIIAIIPWLVIGIRNRFSSVEIVAAPLVAITCIYAINLGLLSFKSRPSDFLFPFEIVFFGLFLSIVHYQIVVKRHNQLLAMQNEKLVTVANTDPMTELFNRRAFEKAFNQEMERVKRHGHELPSVAIMDLDHFKNVNDTYGHDIGDDVLKIFANVLKNNVRVIDVPARWGGEEFVLILPHTSPSNALVVLERIRVDISKKKMPSPADDLVVTVSIGVAAVKDENVTAEQAVKNADNALYEAKDTGRNRICMFNDSTAAET